LYDSYKHPNFYNFWRDNECINEKEVLGGTNLPAFPVEMVAIVTLAEDCM
jgi:hypothetical protein